MLGPRMLELTLSKIATQGCEILGKHMLFAVSYEIRNVLEAKTHFTLDHLA